MARKAGFYLVIEGMDYSGKGTLIQGITNLLVTNNPIQYIREPGGTSFGESIRKLVLEDQTEGTRLTSTEELALMQTQRSYLHRKVITPALCANKNIVSDRGEASSYVYQVNEENEALYRQMHDTMGIRPPDCFIYLDIDYRTYCQRKRARGVLHAFHDEMDEATFEARKARYYDYVKALPTRTGFVVRPRPTDDPQDVLELCLTVLSAAGFEL